MERHHRILLLTAAIALPVTVTAVTLAHSALKSAPDSFCFASGANTYRVAQEAISPDYRVRLDNAAAAPDLRIQVVQAPDLADFVLADDFTAPGSACPSSVPVKTVKLDAAFAAPDVTIAISTDAEAPDYRIYVHSARYSHQDVAAILAAIWKASQARKVAGRS